jgi:hypothetical protein
MIRTLLRRILRQLQINISRHGTETVQRKADFRARLAEVDPKNWTVR